MAADVEFDFLAQGTPCSPGGHCIAATPTGHPPTRLLAVCVCIEESTSHNTKASKTELSESETSDEDVFDERAPRVNLCVRVC